MPQMNQSQVDASVVFVSGIHVVKAAATLPQTTTQHLFVVTGLVLITQLIGRVTVAIQNTDPVLKVTSTPTVGSAVDVASTVDTSSLEIGGFLTVEGDGTAIVKGNAGAGLLGSQIGRWMCPAGYIDLISGASKTGAMKWDLWYVPLEDGSSVVSA